MTDLPEVFLSYAREDRARVEDVYDTLSAEGFKPWMDTRDIQPGHKWASAIGEAIRRADFMLVFISQNSISKRGYIHREVKIALSILSERPEKAIFLIPVRLDHSDPPEALRHIQFVDLFESQGWKILLESLRTGLKRGEVSSEGIHELKEEFWKADQAKKEEKGSHVFIAMPFDVEMEDLYHYGIKRAVHTNGFRCERIDKTAFTGDILDRIKSSIQTAVAVVAVLTGTNVNVHIELGYAWGKEIPTILLLRDGGELCFDVRGQKCLMYHNIMHLEDLLTKELQRLKANGSIGNSNSS